MLGVVVEIRICRPVSASVLVSTPTGSTACVFSAEARRCGPTEAILVVPNNAQCAWFGRMVTSPEATVAIEIEADGHDALGVLRRSPRMLIPAGSRLRSPAVSRPSNGHGWTVRWPTDRLVQVPVAGAPLARKVAGAPKALTEYGSSRWAPSAFSPPLSSIAALARADQWRPAPATQKDCTYLVLSGRCNSRSVRKLTARCQRRFTTDLTTRLSRAFGGGSRLVGGRARREDGSATLRSISRDGPSRLPGGRVPAKSLSGSRTSVYSARAERPAALMRPDEQRCTDRLRPLAKPSRRHRAAGCLANGPTRPRRPSQTGL